MQRTASRFARRPDFACGRARSTLHTYPSALSQYGKNPYLHHDKKHPTHPIGHYNGINYYQLTPKAVTPEQVSTIARLIATAFLDEPMTNHLNIGFDRMHKLVNIFMPECVENESSVFATVAGDDTPIGAFICRDFKNPISSDIEKLIDADFAVIMDVLTRIDTGYEKRIEELGRPALEVGQAMDLWMAGVVPTARKRNIANHLTHIALDLAHHHGFQFAVMEATSAFTQAVCHKFGFAPMAQVRYSEYMLDGKHHFIELKPPHEEAILFEKSLKHHHRVHRVKVVGFIRVEGVESRHYRSGDRTKHWGASAYTQNLPQILKDIKNNSADFDRGLHKPALAMEKKQDSVSPSVIYEITGLPIDVVVLILARMDGRAGMLLGLTNKSLLKWIDSNELYWADLCDQSEAEVKTFDDKTLTSKRRYSMSFAALDRFSRPDFDGSYSVQRTAGLELRSHMQNGAAFAISTHTHVENYSSYDVSRPQFASFLDMTHWPQLDVLKVPPPDQPGQEETEHHHLVGRKSVITQMYSTTPAAIEMDLDPLLKRTTHYKEKLKRKMQRIRPPRRESNNWIATTSENAKFERIAFVGYSNGEWVACVYDSGLDVWSDFITLATFRVEYEYFSTSFNGEYLLLSMSDQIVVISFSVSNDAAPPQPPKMLWQGPFPQALKNLRMRTALGEKHLLLLHNTTEKKDKDATGKRKRRREKSADKRIDEADRRAEIRTRLIRVPLDQLESFDSITKASLDVCAVFPPLSASFVDWYHISSYGPLVAIFYSNEAVIIHMSQKRIVRRFEVSETITSIRFVDSTIFVVFSSKFITVVDMLSRRRTKMTTEMHAPLQLYCFNYKKQKIVEKYCDVSDVSKTVVDLLGGDRSALQATHPEQNNILIVFRVEMSYPEYLDHSLQSLIDTLILPTTLDTSLHFPDVAGPDAAETEDSSDEPPPLKPAFVPSHSRSREKNSGRHSNPASAVVKKEKGKEKQKEKEKDKDHFDAVFCRIQFENSHPVWPALMEWSLTEAEASRSAVQEAIQSYKQWLSNLPNY